jgi:hypothetical protein
MTFKSLPKLLALREIKLLFVNRKLVVREREFFSHEIQNSYKEWQKKFNNNNKENQPLKPEITT